ncbi:DNA replication/repair protein RecF [Candidatus Chlamydia sanziniae]|uniref:DNA replication and repair protein RecF n=1 Tax=Candidatus Chlamydia sanziniae TaxID=1806891 RepID=A0A1A9HYG4_9CHLA|nr:DNA replication/repair protein RecF [Candidatus Chlamydia sanziniae]ANH79084.1 DNA recombination and repair protein RecF [Candidatus Chlamydia sanziniae]
MKILSLTLKNFRNYKDTEVSFSPNSNYILGENAQGKTNLLEALYVLSLGRSFRTLHITDAITFGAPYFFLKITFEKAHLPQILSIYADKHGKKILYNQTPIKTLSELIGIIPIVFFSSRDCSLISGAPANRRLFLNVLLSQCDSQYIYKLASYHRALLQRNTLLKNKQTATLTIWEEQLVKFGAYLSLQRFSCCEQLNNLTQELWKNSLNEQLELKFKSSLVKSSCPTEATIAEEFRKQLASSISRDLELGNTSIGPHREDFHLTINQLPASLFSSEGQKHSHLAILRLAECRYLQQAHDVYPLICMDDIHAGLDNVRASQLLDLAPTLGQTFISSTYIDQQLLQNNHVLRIENGQVTPHTCI